MSYDALELTPGQRGILSLVIRPPRNSYTEEGSHDFNVHVYSSATDEPTTIRGTLTINAFHNLSMEMMPDVNPPGEPFSIRIKNSGTSHEELPAGLNKSGPICGLVLFVVNSK